MGDSLTPARRLDKARGSYTEARRAFGTSPSNRRERAAPFPRGSLARGGDFGEQSWFEREGEHLVGFLFFRSAPPSFRFFGTMGKLAKLLKKAMVVSIEDQITYCHKTIQVGPHVLVVTTATVDTTGKGREEACRQLERFYFWC